MLINKHGSSPENSGVDLSHLGNLVFNCAHVVYEDGDQSILIVGEVAFLRLLSVLSFVVWILRV